MAAFENQAPTTNDHPSDQQTDARIKLHAEVTSTQGPADRTTKYADGVVVREDSHGHVTHIDRTNGTSVDAKYKGSELTTLIERKGSQSWTWKREGNTDFWHSMDMIGSTLLHFRLNERGQETYQNPSGNSYTVNGDGSQNVAFHDGTKAEYNEKSQLTHVRRADGSELFASYDGKTFNHLKELSKSSSVDWSKEPNGNWVSPQSPAIRRQLGANPDGHERYIELQNDQVTSISYLSGFRRDFKYEDGSIVSIHEHSKTGDRTWTRSGSSDIWHSGSISEIRRHVSVNEEGTYSYFDGQGRLQVQRFNDTEAVLAGSSQMSSEVAAAQDKLLKLASDKISDADELASFRTDLDEFVKRGPARHLSTQSMAAALHDISSLLGEAPSRAKVKGDDRLDLAEELMHEIAHPRSGNQNPFGTCAATSAQNIIAERAPEKLTSLIRLIADTGQFTTTSGAIVELSADQIARDFNSRNYKAFDDSGARGYSGQLFQLVATNAAYISQHKHLRYVEIKPSAPLDSGERNVDTKSGAKSDWTGLTGPDIVAIGKEVAGIQIPVWYQGKNDDFASADQLGKLIREHSKNETLPAVLFVMPKNEPFYTLTGHPLLGKDAPGGHFVTLWDIDAADNVLVGNQWGTESHYEGLHRISLNDIYAASRR